MQCSVEVYRGSSNIRNVGHYSRCTRQALPGKTHCWQHDPKYIEEREKDNLARREATRRNKELSRRNRRIYGR